MTHEHLSERVNKLSESATLQMTRKSRQLKEEGKDVINLSIGEPDFDTPMSIKEAAIAAIKGNITHYPPVSGYKELKQAIVDKLKRENNLDYHINQIIVSNGAKQSIANSILSLVNHGDEVLLPSPFWVSYPEMIKLAGGKSVFLQTGLESDFKVTPQQVEESITEKTKVFLFNSPCNPSGTVYHEDELQAIAEVLATKEDLYIISDEIYEHINFIGEHTSIARFDVIKDRVVTINGVSKSFAMTGWRIGYAAAPEYLADAMDTLQGQYTSGASSISQMAALKALEADARLMPELKAMKEAFRQRRDLALKRLNEIPGLKLNIPEGAFYIFPDVSYYYGKKNGDTVIRDGYDLCMYLLEKVHVALVPGAAFGSYKHIRISYATSTEELNRAFDRIESALAELK
jgi:aspartate aminotransferase